MLLALCPIWAISAISIISAMRLLMHECCIVKKKNAIRYHDYTYACALYQRRNSIAMDGAHPDIEGRGLPLITLPMRSLLVLSGPAGAGKSTFARKLVQAHAQQGLQPTKIVSSDECRALICDDENNQQVNRDAFDLFHYIINKRMFLNRFTIADSTALHASARYRLLDLTQRHHYY